ncbi:MAG: hypothetical protein J6K04_01525 [Lachnospiraceae bacterium]|nr:hypothetical protein [Lachnospiraceae bacterium]
MTKEVTKAVAKETTTKNVTELVFILDRSGSMGGLEAIGGAIHHIGNVHKYAREEDRPDKTIFIITTDGMENASRRYTYDKVKEMVERQKSTYGWEFLFLGANMDAIEVAGRFGIAADRAVNFECDSKGTQLNYQVLGETVSLMRSCSAREVSERLGSAWKGKIEKDYQKRHR